MGRTARIPQELKCRPFTLKEARAAGISPRSLSGRSWRRLATELYCWRALEIDPWMLLSAWQRVLPSDAVFAGPTAAWLVGLDLQPIDPIEIILPQSSGVRSRTDLKVRRCHLLRSDITVVRGLRATSVRRTLRDLRRQSSEVDTLIALDAALRKGLIDQASLADISSLAPFAAPAESPMETRLRWLLIKARLPRPEVQTDLRDADGRFVGRADLYYPSARLVIEYDGVNHRNRLIEDNRRQNLLINAGFRLLRFTAADVEKRADVVEALVRQALTR